MIDLTPLDIRKKKSDFRRGLRGYESAEVDSFLDLVAERLEELVRENNQLRERSGQLSQDLTSFRAREQAMNEALVSAQQLREEIRAQTQREAEVTLREAKAEGERLVMEARMELEREREALQRTQAHRTRFLRAYRTFLEGQLAEIRVEEERTARPRSATRPDDGQGTGGDV